MPRALSPVMHLEWMIEVERQLHWALEAHGGTALSAAIWGFGLLMGAMVAVGLVTTWRRAVGAWRARPLGAAAATPASIDVEIADSAPGLSTISLPLSRPPPLPGRLLN